MVETGEKFLLVSAAPPLPLQQHHSMITSIILILIFLVALLSLLPTPSLAQDSCYSRSISRVVWSPQRVVDSAFQPSVDKWTYVSYEINQDHYSEVHLKYLCHGKWKEAQSSYKQGVSVLSACVPPGSWVLVECLSLNKQPEIVKQVEIEY